MASSRLQDKVALITGGARGIGECIARTFTKHGAKVVITDIQDNLGESLCKEMGPDVASFVRCNVTSEPDIENAIDSTMDIHGKLDIMINNAGILDEGKSSILDNEKSVFDQVMSINVTGAFLGCKHAARVMIPAHSGSIISIASVCSITGGLASHAYTTSKHAVVGMTKNVASELGRHQIRVNCVSPYIIPTALALKFFKLDENSASKIYTNLKGINLRAQDIADACVFLGSDESNYVSGHNLVVDGGYTVINPIFGLYAPRD